MLASFSCQSKYILAWLKKCPNIVFVLYYLEIISTIVYSIISQILISDYKEHIDKFLIIIAIYSKTTNDSVQN